MNFFILSADGKCTTRPDSSRNKDNGDFYLPDDVLSVGYSPCIFARMGRTGKAVEKEFAVRYYDAINFGVLLYPSVNDGSRYCRATCGCFDHSSLLSLPLYNPVTLDDGLNNFVLKSDDKVIFECKAEGKREIIEKSIVECSTHSTIHKGDFVIAELAEVGTLCRREDDNLKVSASFCGNTIIDIDIKF